MTFVEIDAQAARETKHILSKTLKPTLGVKLSHIGEAVVAGYGFDDGSVADATLRGTTALVPVDGGRFAARLLALTGQTVDPDAFAKAVDEAQRLFEPRRLGTGVILGRVPALSPSLSVAGSQAGVSAVLDPRNQPGRIVVEKSPMVLVVAPPGTHKTTSVVVPTVANFDGGVVLVDTKGEIGFMTERSRQEKHGEKVYKVDPTSERTAWLDPLASIQTRSAEDARASAEMLFGLTFPVPKNARQNENVRFWWNMARDVLCGLFAASALGLLPGAGIRAVMDVLSLPQAPEVRERDLIAELKADPNFEATALKEIESLNHRMNDPAENKGELLRQIMRLRGLVNACKPSTAEGGFETYWHALCALQDAGLLVERHENIPEQTMAGIRMRARSLLDWILDNWRLGSGIERCFMPGGDRPRVDVDAICRGEATVYLSFDNQTVLQSPATVNIMLAALTVAKAWSDSKAPVLFALDEAPRYLHDFSLSNADSVIEEGGRYLLVFQDHGQIDECLGRRAEWDDIAGVPPVVVATGPVHANDYRARGADMFGPEIVDRDFDGVLVARQVVEDGEPVRGEYEVQRLEATPYYATSEFGDLVNARNPYYAPAENSAPAKASGSHYTIKTLETETVLTNALTGARHVIANAEGPERILVFVKRLFRAG